MATNKNELAQRLSAVAPQDTIRGLGFRTILQLVRERLGQRAAEELQRQRLDRPPVDFFPYPASQFLELLYAASDRLEHVYGSTDAAFRAMGAATTTNFFDSTVGKTLALMIGRDAHRLFSSAASAYGSIVSYGTRECTRLGDHKVRLVFKGDMQPVPYHEGTLGECLNVVGARGTVQGTALGLTEAEYLVEWKA